MLKNCALLSLCAGVSLAAEFVTGQAARLVIGQTTFTTQESGASAKLLGGAGGLALTNGKLFIADANRLNLTPINNRVLMMDTSTFPKATDEIAPASGRCPVCVGEATLVLGQADFTSTTAGVANKFRLPVGVATDGVRLAVADTLNNRVLIWNSLPTTNGQPPDVVVGQPRMDVNKSPVVTDAKSLRAPQGVWLQNGRLFVADTQNHRVLIWNVIPTANEQAPDIVLGQDNFTSSVELDPVKQNITIAADSVLTPTSVSSDGIRLFVTDIGLNRVVIWNALPTRNHQPADVVIGQPDMASHDANNVSKLCLQVDRDRDGALDTDESGNPVYPFRCGKTLNFPRFALSDGQRLFVADGGNDRVLIFNTIPTQNAPKADIILGQPDEFLSTVSSATDLFHPLLKQSAADITPTPTSLAWDGKNLYVADPSNRRILVFSEGEPLIPINGVRNAASREIFALGGAGVFLTQTFNPTTGVIEPGVITEGDTVTLKIADSRSYTYTVKDADSLVGIMVGLVALVNANEGDPEVFAKYEPVLNQIKLQAKKGGTEGNDILIEMTVSEDAGITASTSGPSLEGGENATVIAPGTLVSLLGADLANVEAVADLSAEQLPVELGNVQAYFDGIRTPLLYVSPTQINAEIPWEVLGSNNISFYLRIRRPDGSVIATSAIAVPIDSQNPGLFAEAGEDPRVAIAFHASSYATAVITVTGGIEEGDTANVNIEGRIYTYTVKVTDTLDSVRDALVALINANPEEAVVAIPQPAFQRIQLRAKIPGPGGEGIAYTANSAGGSDGTLSLTVFATSQALCCSNVKDARVTLQNPAIPGETIYLFATGLGPVSPAAAQDLAITGKLYRGPELNTPQSDVNALGNGSTANVVAAGLMPGTHGLYKLVLELGPGTQVNGGRYAGLNISQFIYTSNTVLIPIRDPKASNVTGP
jgi:uncharacterized protein (TIGR03437 family)